MVITELQQRQIDLLKSGRIAEAIQLTRESQLPGGTDYDRNERVEQDVEFFNSRDGNLADGIDCPVCKNRGQIYVVREDEGHNKSMAVRICECMLARRARNILMSSGLAKAVETSTLEQFRSDTDWQRVMLQDAKTFTEAVRSGEKAWFFVGGQSGCGKTHLCTGICIEMMQKDRRAVTYMQWRSDGNRLKLMNDAEERAEAMEKYLRADVLYIDDFLKTPLSSGMNASQPSLGDMNLAFEIINGRYLERKTTVISSEWMLDEIMDMDTATGSRIYEMVGEHFVEISENPARNYRITDRELEEIG